MAIGYIIEKKTYMAYRSDQSIMQFGCIFNEKILCGAIVGIGMDSNISHCPVIFMYHPSEHRIYSANDIFDSAFACNSNGCISFGNGLTISYFLYDNFGINDIAIGVVNFRGDVGNTTIWNDTLIDADLFVPMIDGVINESILYDYTNDEIMKFYEYLDSLPRPKKKFEEEISVIGGGDGEMSETSDENILDEIEVINNDTFLSTFFVSQYRLTLEQLKDVSKEFWSDNFITQIKQKFNNPMDSIISLQMLPVSATGESHDVIIGSYNTNVNALLVKKQFVEINCGDIIINEYWGSALDYSPHTKIDIFLPFIGMEVIDADDVMNSTINLKYRVDVVTGSCIAILTRIKDGKRNIMYQWNGNCSYNIPVTSNSYSNIINGMIQMIGRGSSLALSGASPATIPALAGSSLAQSKKDVSRSGSASCANGFMGYRKPYLIVNRPVQSLPNDFEKYKGFQSNITSQLGKLKGFTKIKEIKLTGIKATDGELDELKTLLTDGVYL